jgi:hypothetical protein
MLSVHSVEGAPAPSGEVMKKMYADVAAFNEKLQQQGRMIFGGGLMPPTQARVVKSEGGKVSLRDGPFAESKELLGGFWILKAQDMETALQVAAEASVACQGPVEVRMFQEPAPE